MQRSRLTGHKWSANFRVMSSLSVIFGFCWYNLRSLASYRDYCPQNNGVLPRVSAGSISDGSHLSCRVVPAGSKRSRTVSKETKYDGQSRQEAKIAGQVYTLCFSSALKECNTCQELGTQYCDSILTLHNLLMMSVPFQCKTLTGSVRELIISIRP